MLLWMAKGTPADVTKGRDLEMGEIILYDPDVPNVITKVLKIGGRRQHVEGNMTSGEQ